MANEFQDRYIQDFAPLFEDKRKSEGRAKDWTYQPTILWGDKNELNTQAETSKLMLATLVARLGGAVQFPVRQLEGCNLTLTCKPVTVDGIAMLRLDTNHHAGNPIKRINEFADRWEQRAAILPPDAAGEIIDMASELRSLAEGLFA